MNHASLKTLGIALIAAMPLMASAQLSGNLSLTSNYKYRGQDQDTSKTRAVKPALQGGFDYAFGESGWYVGNWNSSVNWLPGNSIEMDLYGGYKFKAGALDWDLGALTYLYPGNTSGNTTELYAATTWGPLTAKYSRVVSSKWFGVPGGKGTGYFEVNAEMEVASGITLVGHVGATQFSGGAKDNGAVNYSDYKLGVGFDLGSGFSLEGAYVGATKKSDWGDINKSRLLLTLSKSL